MYCYEAQKCTKYDCPVQRNQVKRCWEFLQRLLGREVTIDDCPWAPCESCNYKLGWEIGLIGESLFPETPDPTPESITPDLNSISQENDQPFAPNVSKKQLDADSLTPELVSPSQNQAEPKNEKTRIISDEAQLNIDDDEEKIGQPGMRFCHEILTCPNPNCIVRRRQIIQCFKFFARKTPEEKEKFTCGDRKCETCFYKRGWEIGILSEPLFQDILEKRKIKVEQSDRIKKNTLVEIYLNELSKKPLSRNEEIELAKKIAGDSEASELFLLANLKLVIRVAKKFSGSGLGLMDLIQEGNIGLIKAIAKFDHTLGYRFSTYAAYWVRYYMQKATASQGTTIKIPHHLLTVANKIKKKIQEYEYQFFRSPTLTELSRTLQISEEKILSVIKITQAPISIHAKMGTGEDDDTLEYYLSDKKNLSPEEVAIEKEKGDSVRAAISRLPERLRYIIENFYGFTEEEKNLAEIGRELNLSRERVRQLLRNALQKLQEDKETLNLQSFID